MKMVMFGCGWKPVWAGDTAAARPGLVRAQAVRRGWRLGALGRLEPTPHLPHIAARSIVRWVAVVKSRVARLAGLGELMWPHCQTRFGVHLDGDADNKIDAV